MAYDYDPPDKFGYKDTLPENHPEKVVTGVEFDDEFLKIEAEMDILSSTVDGLVSSGGLTDAPNDGETYGRKSKAWVAVAEKAHTHEISNIDGLPDFIADHTHEIADIDTLQDQLDAINNALSTITSNLVFGGSYDLENDIVLRSTKEDDGLLEGQPLPADGVIFDTFMILVSGGTMKGETLARGDWIVADGAGEWIPIPYSIAESIDWGNIQGTPDFDNLYAPKNHTHSQYLEDAPLDGEQYARQSGSWAIVSKIAGPEGPDGPQGAKGDKGDGWTGGSYNPSNGVVTFTSDDGLGFVTGDLRGATGSTGGVGPEGPKGDGWTGGSYDASTGIVTFTSDDGLGFSTGDLRGEDSRISDSDIAEWNSHDNYQYWRYQVNGFGTTNVMSQHTLNFEAGDNIEITSIAGGISIKGTTAPVDLTGYATESWVTAGFQPKGSYLTSSDLTGLATESWVSTNYQVKGSYLTSSDLSGYATETWVGSNYQPKGSYLTSESDPTVPSHVKSITTSDISAWNTAAGSGFSGSYNDLSDKPSTFPPSAHGHGWGEISGKPTTFTPSAHGHGWTEISSKPSTYPPSAHGHSWGDISGAPTIPTKTSQLTNDSGFVTSSVVSGYATEAWVNAKNYSTYTGSDAVKTSGNQTIGGAKTFSSNVTAPDFVATSDERAKENISPMPVGLIDDIKPVQWTWKESGERSAGVIAQQLQEIGLDDFVREDENGMLGVNYNALISVLIAEVINLKKERQ